MDRVATPVGDLAQMLATLSDALDILDPPITEDIRWAIGYAARSRASGNDQVALWLQEQQRKRENEPFIPTGRKQGVPMGKSVVMVDPDGRRWSMDVQQQGGGG